MTKTTNLELNKPDGNDFYSIELQNENMDILDSEVKKSINHIANVNNPHGVTKTQVGLGNVPNVATNDQTPTYTVASNNTALSSGEKISVALGKIARCINSLISHLADSVSHITATERTAWNAKADEKSLENYLQLSGGTMTGPLILSTWARIRAHIDKGTIPSSGFFSGVGVYDKNGTGTSNLLGYLQTTIDTDGNISTKMAAFNNQPGSAANVGISCIYRKDGMAYTEAPTPPAGDNSTKIATTAFVKNQGYVPIKIQETAPTDTAALWVW